MAATRLADAAGAEPVLRPLADADFHYSGRPNAAQVELGRLLFYDKILSGNRNIACASCHHPEHATGDGLPLSIGEGGSGLGTQRDAGQGPTAVAERIGRNAQPLFNLGAIEFTTLFHDGRVEVDPRDATHLLTPIGAGLPPGLDNALAAQALFPLLSADEMAGRYGENGVANAAALGDSHAAWAMLVQRIRDIPEYVERMAAAYPHIAAPEDVGIVEIGNAIAAFTTAEWRADSSRFDAYLRGDSDALDADELRGFELFYGAAGCGTCHAGALQTDHRFHAIAMPQIGPGKGHGFDGHDDFGRELVTGNPADRYRFRTPSLRNVVHTGPWGHSGAYDTLEGVVRHHLDPAGSLRQYDAAAPLQPSRPDLDARDFLVQHDETRVADIAARNQLAGTELSDADVAALLAFLDALSDPTSLGRTAGVPARVPSGLPVAD